MLPFPVRLSFQHAGIITAASGSLHALFLVLLIIKSILAWGLLYRFCCCWKSSDKFDWFVISLDSKKRWSLMLFSCFCPWRSMSPKHCDIFFFDPRERSSPQIKWELPRILGIIFGAFYLGASPAVDSEPRQLVLPVLHQIVGPLPRFCCWWRDNLVVILGQVYTRLAWGFCAVVNWPDTNHLFQFGMRLIKPYSLRPILPFINMDISRHILVLDTSVFMKGNIGWKEYHYMVWYDRFSHSLALH
jgi:hypothetical protein